MIHSRRQFITHELLCKLLRELIMIAEPILELFSSLNTVVHVIECVNAPT